MNNHAGMRLRKQIAAAGNTRRGSHPGQAVAAAAAVVVVGDTEFK
jgi:hypothetical protein